MIEAALEGIKWVMQPSALGLMFIGIIIGIVFGAIPGLSGMTALAILIPFAAKMGPIHSFSLLLGAHVATEFGGSISSILVNTPGTGKAVATCFDGFPMAQKGEAARAISIAATASGIGGLIGFAMLVGTLPISRAAVMALSAPEFFLLAFMGLSFIALLSEGSATKGFIAGGLGVLLSMVGVDPVTSVPRYTFGWLALFDGLSLIPVIVGFFAVAQMIELAREGLDGYISQVPPREDSSNWGQVWQGIKDNFIYWKVNVATSSLGVLIGFIPGLGGTVANVMSYALAKKIAKHPEEFGQGSPEGIIGPEASNNSTEGGGLIPTIAFGIPGSSSMAIFMGVFIMMGIVPGPDMLTKNLNATFSLCWILAIANIFSTLLGLLIAGYISKITFVPNRYLIPVVLSVGCVGAFIAADDIAGVITSIAFGFLGYGFKRFGFSKASFVVGIVLGNVVERYLHLSVSMFGPFFIFRPICMMIVAFVIGAIVWKKLSYRAKKAV